MGYRDQVPFETLKGKTLTAIEGMEKGSDVVRLYTTDGDTFLMYHYQDCCESVYIEDVIGDPDDLIGPPILMAEEVEGETPANHEWEYAPDSYTWTFYKLATVRGYVTLRWLGQSNGYYSESVSFEKER